MTGSAPSEHPSGIPPNAPAPLVVAAAVVLLEGVLTAVYGVVELFGTTSARLVMGVTTGVFLVAYGAALAVCAWGMRRLLPWSRGPVLLTQLILLGLAWNFREGKTLPLAIGLAVVAVLALIGVLHPRSVAVLNREDYRSPD